jgi:hypothetical protein
VRLTVRAGHCRRGLDGNQDDWHTKAWGAYLEQRADHSNQRHVFSDSGGYFVRTEIEARVVKVTGPVTDLEAAKRGRKQVAHLKASTETLKSCSSSWLAYDCPILVRLLAVAWSGRAGAVPHAFFVENIRSPQPCH